MPHLQKIPSGIFTSWDEYSHGVIISSRSFSDKEQDTIGKLSHNPTALVSYFYKEFSEIIDYKTTNNFTQDDNSIK